MLVGIPKGLLYYDFEFIFKEFFKELDVEYITSPDTNKEIYQTGMNHAMDESCLPLKVFLGHVDYLIGKCDYILVPRIGGYGYYDRMCTRYMSTIDLVYNTFRDEDFKILPFNIDYTTKDSEMKSFIAMGKILKKRRRKSILAYRKAKHLRDYLLSEKERTMEEKLKSNKIKILLVGHKYNVYDHYSGSIIVDYLERMGVEIVIATDMEGKKADFYSKELTDTMPWTFNRELIGSVYKLKSNVDGIILISSFNCGPDSMANEIILRKIKNIPILNLVIDGQEGIIGLETRLESFLDIITFKKGDGLFVR